MTAMERRESQRLSPERLFPDLFDILESPFSLLRPWAGMGAAEQTIRVEEYVQDGEFIICAELPGIDPDKDVEITVTGDTLRIHAERHTERKEAHRSEFRYGSLSRSLKLPAGVKVDDVKARYDKGILQITVPVPQAKQATQRIAVEKIEKK